MESKQYKLLFLCTGNSARSIFGEYLLRRLGGSRFQVFPADLIVLGTHDRGGVRRFFLQYSAAVAKRAHCSVRVVRGSGVSQKEIVDMPMFKRHSLCPSRQKSLRRLIGLRSALAAETSS